LYLLQISPISLMGMITPIAF
jgi:hypothetical protein